MGVVRGILGGSLRVGGEAVFMLFSLGRPSRITFMKNANELFSSPCAVETRARFSHHKFDKIIENLKEPFLRRFLLFVKFSRYRRCHGMTLIEILLVASLLSLVSLAIYQSLSLGIKVWERSRGSMIEQDIVLAFEKLTQDARNAVYFSLWPPQGDSRSIRFVTLVPHPEMNYETQEEGIVNVQKLAQVSYEYDSGQKSLTRMEQNYSQASQQATGTRLRLLKNIENMGFRYFQVTAAGEEIRDQMDVTYPSVLEVEIVFTDSLGERRLKKLIDFPLSW